MNKVTAILAVLLISLCANAQEKPIRFGVKAGMNLSSVSDIKGAGNGITVAITQSDGMSVGFHVGGFMNYSFSQLIGIQHEFVFSMQGGKQKLSSFLAQQLPEVPEMPAFPEVSTSYAFYYVNMPILFELKPVAGLSILAGPQFGFNVYKSVTYQDITYSGDEFNDEGFNPFDVSIAMGLQYAFARKFHVGARYNLGLTKTASYNQDGISVSAWKHNVIQFSIGCAF
ncbi:MAG: PorT family protein [Prevotellaceae bacterium]|jgi:hypothetical protein|nr:PorT family protein [Prevotellaceae bacterium]